MVVVPAALAVHQCAALPELWVRLTLLAVACLLMLASCASAVSALRPVLLLIAISLIVAVWTIDRADRALAQRITVEQEGVDFRVEGRISGLPQPVEHGVRFDFTIDACAGGPSLCPLGKAVRLSWQRQFGRTLLINEALDPTFASTEADAKAPALMAGERWRLLIRLRRPHATVNPGLFDAELRLLQEGIAGLGYVRSARGDADLNRRIDVQGHPFDIAAIRDRTRQALRQVTASASSDLSALVVALAVGDQAALGPQAWEIFNRTGVAHLMSISGLHITMLAGLALAASRRVLRIPGPWTTAILMHCDAARLSWGFALFTAFAYSMLAGWGIPAQRTCWMLAACALAVNTGRSGRMRDVLLFAAAVVTISDPWAPLAPGFWLSFFAVGAIVWHASTQHRPVKTTQQVSGQGLVRRWRQQGLRWLSEAAASQWAVTIALLPLSAWFFASASVIGPLANALAIPVVSFLITPAALLMAVLAPIWPWAARRLADLIDPVVQVLMSLLSDLASPSWAALVMGSPPLYVTVLASLAALILIAPLRWPGRYLVLPVILAVLYRPVERPTEGSVHMTVLDIGQGMAVLIETAEGRLLYDTGPAFGHRSDAGSRVLVPYLQSKGISKLEALVISHADIDHAGGAVSVLKSISVSRVLSSLDASSRVLASQSQPESCHFGLGWVWSGVRFDFLHPQQAEAPSGRKSSTNSRSCVLRVSTGAGSILLTGDIEAREERLLLSKLAADQLRADILLAPHHGSATSSTAPFIEAVAPRWVIAQVGYRNRFRHPAAAVVRRYESAGATLLRSDHTGAVEIRLRPGTPPSVRIARGSDAPYWRVRPAY